MSAEQLNFARTLTLTEEQRKIVDTIDAELQADDAESEEIKQQWQDQAKHQLETIINEYVTNNTQP